MLTISPESGPAGTRFTGTGFKPGERLLYGAGAGRKAPTTA